MSLLMVLGRGLVTFRGLNPQEGESEAEKKSTIDQTDSYQPVLPNQDIFGSLLPIKKLLETPRKHLCDVLEEVKPLLATNLCRLKKTYFQCQNISNLS